MLKVNCNYLNLVMNIMCISYFVHNVNFKGWYQYLVFISLSIFETKHMFSFF